MCTAEFISSIAFNFIGAKDTKFTT